MTVYLEILVCGPEVWVQRLVLLEGRPLPVHVVVPAHGLARQMLEHPVRAAGLAVVGHHVISKLGNWV